MDPQLIEMMLKYPIIVQLLSVMAVCRLIFKPISSAFIKYVEETPDKEDDTKLAAFLANPKVKVLLYVLDMLFSIKLPQKEVKKES